MSELKSVYIDRTGDWVRSGTDTGNFYLKSGADEVIAELKAKLENAKATAYAESVDAGMRERRLKHALWLTRAMRAHDKQHWTAYLEHTHFHENTFYKFDGDDILKRDNRNYDSFKEWDRRWITVEHRCKAKAEEYR